MVSASLAATIFHTIRVESACNCVPHRTLPGSIFIKKICYMLPGRHKQKLVYRPDNNITNFKIQYNSRAAVGHFSAAFGSLLRVLITLYNRNLHFLDRSPPFHYIFLQFSEYFSHRSHGVFYRPSLSSNRGSPAKPRLSQSFSQESRCIPAAS